MEKKSIGQFMSALRKAKGMTQQDVADRLNVSNKSVSRWERDENAPDLSLIPAIAELFGVTCDELLKGERIFTSGTAPEKSEPKVEKQLKALVNRSISSFKTLVWASLALSVVGFICMFGISYGFYRPVIGFAVMLMFEAAAFALSAIAVNRMKEIKADNELFENAPNSLIAKFNNCLSDFSFAAFFAVVSAILLSLPLIFTDSAFSVLWFEGYLTLFFPFIVLVLVLIFLEAKEPYAAWITEQPGYERRRTDPTVRRLNMLQSGMTVLAGLMFIIASYFPNTGSILYEMFNVIGLALLLANIICFIVFIIKYKMKRSKLWLAGIGNMLMIPSALLLTLVHTTGVFYIDKDNFPQTYVAWYEEYLFLSILVAAVVGIVFRIIDILISRKKKDTAKQ